MGLDTTAADPPNPGLACSASRIDRLASPPYVRMSGETRGGDLIDGVAISPSTIPTRYMAPCLTRS